MKKYCFVIYTLMLISLSGCKDGISLNHWWEQVYSKNPVISAPGVITNDVTIRDGAVLEVQGRCTVKNGATITFEPGSMLKLIETIEFPFLADIGRLVFKDGARIIVRGSKSKPVKFETDSVGSIEVLENAGNNNFIEYCRITNVSLSLERSGVIQNSKILDGAVYLYADTNVRVINNNFISSYEISALNMIKGGGGQFEITYNDFSGYSNPIDIFDNSVGIISNNNIRKSRTFAIETRQDKIIVDSNYISDCNGKQGPDINGAQVSVVGPYTNPRTEPVPGAGCGW